MSKSKSTGFWSYLSRKLTRRGSLATAHEVEELRKEVLKLRRQVTGTQPWRSASMPQQAPKDEGELFLHAWKMGCDGEPGSAIKLLDQRADSVKRVDELRIVQAAIAYRVKWDGDALFFLEMAVDAANPARTTLYWGPTAIISNSYWSRAMKEGGWDSKTLMWDVSHINHASDFDLLVENVMPSWLVFKDREEMFSHAYLPHMLAFLHVIRHASVIHVPVTGSFLGMTRLWPHETVLFRRAGVKTVLLPYGGDYYCYSRVEDPCVRYGLLANYPELARKESDTQARLSHWQQGADCVLSGYMVDAMGRWDVTTFNFFHIDTRLWPAAQEYSKADGRNGPVSVVHTPNHRGFKGTEFLLQAAEDLRAEGLQIDLRLLERVPNSEVRRVMQQSDILAEQFIATAYAMSGMEGMACGLPVMANLESEYYTKVFRRYSFLNECPILSTKPETLKHHLRLLVTRPDLRAELGRAGRAYVEKYHSFEAARHLFGSIYDRILHGKEVDLINLFHPLTSESARSRPPVPHPLVENRLPADSPFLR
jgi:glycosyltransferase involved in cell wall biosynthesis